MNKIIFKNQYFYFGLIVFILILLVYNLISIFSDFEIKTFAPIIIQIFILVLILEKHKILKLVLKIWSGIFFIGAFALTIIGKCLKDMSYDFQTFNVQKYLFPILMLSIGILIFILTEKTIEIRKQE